MSKPKYAIVADRESVLAQSGRATLICYESDYYGNYVEIATGNFHDMSKLAKTLNGKAATDLTLMPNPEVPSDAQLLEWYDLAEDQLADAQDGLLGLRAIWRAGCDAGMVAPRGSEGP